MKNKKLIFAIIIQLLCLIFAYLNKKEPFYNILNSLFTNCFEIIYISSLFFLLYQLVAIISTKNISTNEYGNHIPTSKTKKTLSSTNNNIIKNILHFLKKHFLILAWLILFTVTIIDLVALAAFYEVYNSPKSFPNANAEGIKTAKFWILSMIALYLTAFTGSIVVLIVSATKSKIISNNKFRAIVAYSYIIIPIIFSILFFFCQSILPPEKIPSLFSALVGLYCFATIKDTCVTIGEALDKEQDK